MKPNQLKLKFALLVVTSFVCWPIAHASLASASKTAANAIAFSMADVDKMEQNFQQELFKEYTRVQTTYKNNAAARNLMTSTETDSEGVVDRFLELARINILVGAFTALDLKIIEFKIQPYVELRFDKP